MFVRVGRDRAITREDLGIDVTMRVYVPDLEKMKTWQAPKAKMVK